MKRLRKSDIKSLNQQLPLELDKKDDVQSDDSAILVDDRFSFFKHNDSWLPALPLLLEDTSLLPRVTVDMGAVRHVVNGADIMRPGITSFEPAQAGDAVVIVDETHGKPLCVGRMLLSSEEAEQSDSGRTVENLHFVGDELWKTYLH